MSRESHERSLIFLIGLPATGKTTLGQALADPKYSPDNSISFADLDACVEAREGVSVSEIFRLRGEGAFRALESETLRRLAEAPGEGTLVIACGGGTPCSEENIAYMLRRGTVVELRADHACTLRRLTEAPREQRPLMARHHSDPEALSRAILDLEARRRPWYSRADATFDSSELESPEQIRRTCARFINLFIEPES